MIDPITQYILEQQNKKPEWYKQNKSKCEKAVRDNLEPYVGAESLFKTYPYKPVSGVAEKIKSRAESQLRKNMAYRIKTKCKDSKNKNECEKQAAKDTYNEIAYGLSHYYLPDCVFDSNCISCYKKVMNLITKYERMAR